MPKTASVVFVTLPEDLSEEIRSQPREPRPGFGSLRVEVTCGSSVWKTSIFPSTGARYYVLPVKKAVRVAEGIAVPDEAEFSIQLLE
jgi:hypothetical protein